MQPFQLKMPGVQKDVATDSQRELLEETATAIRRGLPQAARGLIVTLVVAWPIELFFYVANLPAILLEPTALARLSIGPVFGVSLGRVRLAHLIHAFIYPVFLLAQIWLCRLGVLSTKRAMSSADRCIRVAVLTTTGLILLIAAYHVVAARYPVAWSGEPEILALALVYVTVGATVFFPWGARSQLTIAAVSIVAFIGAYELKVGTPESVGVPLLGVTLIGALSVGSARLLERHRSESMRRAAELANAYAELKSAQVQLVQTEKMASLGRLVAGVAHEINNSVTRIVCSVSPLRGRVKQLATRVPAATFNEVREIEELVDIMAFGAERIAAFVRDLRTFSHLGEASRKTIDLHEGIEVTLRLLEPRWHGRVLIHRNYGDLPLVECDPGQMNQVFVNLLANASDAVARNIWITTSARNGTVTVSIRDDGCGIPPEVVGRIFDPFVTTKEVGQGTGFGLAISEAVVAGHGGRIEVDSAVGAGSTFRISLPVASADLRL